MVREPIHAEQSESGTIGAHQQALTLPSFADESIRRSLSIVQLALSAAG